MALKAAGTDQCWRSRVQPICQLTVVTSKEIDVHILQSFTQRRGYKLLFHTPRISIAHRRLLDDLLSCSHCESFYEAVGNNHAGARRTMQVTRRIMQVHDGPCRCSTDYAGARRAMQVHDEPCRCTTENNSQYLAIVLLLQI